MINYYHTVGKNRHDPKRVICSVTSLYGKKTCLYATTWWQVCVLTKAFAIDAILFHLNVIIFTERMNEWMSTSWKQSNLEWWHLKEEQFFKVNNWDRNRPVLKTGCVHLGETVLNLEDVFCLTLSTQLGLLFMLHIHATVKSKIACVIVKPESEHVLRFDPQLFTFWAQHYSSAWSILGKRLSSSSSMHVGDLILRVRIHLQKSSVNSGHVCCLIWSLSRRI